MLEQLEHLLDVLTRVLLAHLGGHYAKELGELDGELEQILLGTAGHIGGG